MNFTPPTPESQSPSPPHHHHNHHSKISPREAYSAQTMPANLSLAEYETPPRGRARLVSLRDLYEVRHEKDVVM